MTEEIHDPYLLPERYMNTPYEDLPPGLQKRIQDNA